MLLAILITTPIGQASGVMASFTKWLLLGKMKIQNRISVNAEDNKLLWIVDTDTRRREIIIKKILAMKGAAKMVIDSHAFKIAMRASNTTPEAVAIVRDMFDKKTDIEFIKSSEISKYEAMLRQD